MKTFFVAMNTTLTPQQLVGKRRLLRQWLAEHSIDVTTLKAGKSVVQRLSSEARAAPVVVIEALASRTWPNGLSDLVRIFTR